MGLDQYLRASKYVSGWGHEASNEHGEYNRLLDMFGMREYRTEGSPHALVHITVAYWRKSNMIHKWFVDNVQDGKDDCGDYELGFEELRELRDLCQRFLENPALAPEELPIQEGFFFGSYEYGDWYFQDLRETVEMLDKVLTIPEKQGWYFQYHSSW